MIFIRKNNSATSFNLFSTMLIAHFGDEYLTPNIVWINWYADSSTSLLFRPVHGPWAGPFSLDIREVLSPAD
jgi:hypothetical protein